MFGPISSRLRALNGLHKPKTIDRSKLRKIRIVDKLLVAE